MEAVARYQERFGQSAILEGQMMEPFQPNRPVRAGGQEQMRRLASRNGKQYGRWKGKTGKVLKR